MVGVLSVIVGWALTREPATPTFPIHESSPEHPAAEFGTALDSSSEEIADAGLHDMARNADIHVRILSPKAAGKFPVIIFSPDDRQSEECCEALIRDWVSHGYVVVQIASSAVLPTDSHVVGSVHRMPWKSAGPAHRSVAASGPGALDISSVIDSLADLQTRFPTIRTKLDRAHIGVAGNADGATAAEAIAGALVELPGQPAANLADPRVRAVLCISPQGPGQSGFTGHSFDQLILPYLGIASTDDTAPAKSGSADWHKAPFERSQPGDKYELSVRGGGHSSMVAERHDFSDDSNQSGEPSESTAGHIRAATLAFWEAYLKHDAAARRYLESDALEKASRGALTLERR
jgi:predicted dienelactone hydrolase